MKCHYGRPADGPGSAQNALRRAFAVESRQVRKREEEIMSRRQTSLGTWMMMLCLLFGMSGISALAKPQTASSTDDQTTTTTTKKKKKKAKTPADTTATADRLALQMPRPLLRKRQERARRPLPVMLRPPPIQRQPPAIPEPKRPTRARKQPRIPVRHQRLRRLPHPQPQPALTPPRLR